jgi:hypothetical protein
MESAIVDWVTDQAMPTSIALAWAVAEFMRNKRLLNVLIGKDRKDEQERSQGSFFEEK